MTNFHAKKVEYIKQEIFAKLILFNFSNIIVSHAVIEKRKQRKQDAKYVYQLNYHMAIRICHKFIAHCSNDTPAPDVLALLSRYLLPVKPGRQFKRNLRGIGAASFVYRIS